MELLGKTLQKEFPRLGILTGEVKSFDSNTGFFEIVYEDGDSEEMEFQEVAFALGHRVPPIVLGRTQIGSSERRPKKRRRCDEGSGGFVVDCLGRDVKSVEISPQIRNSPNGANLETLDGKLSINRKIDRFDLNVDISMGEDEVDVEEEEEPALARNLEENDLGCGVERKEKVRHCFDINLTLEEEDEEIEDPQVEGLREFEKAESSAAVGQEIQELPVKELGFEVEFRKVDSVVPVEGTQEEAGSQGNGRLESGDLLKDVEIESNCSNGLSLPGVGNAGMKETAEEDTRLKDNNGLSEHLIEKEDRSSLVLKETQLKATIDLSLPGVGNAGLKETVEDTQLKDNNGLSEHLIEKEDNSSVVLKETQLKPTIDLSLPVMGNAGVKETAEKDTRLKDNNGLSEHLIEKQDHSSVVLNETQLKATIDLSLPVMGNAGVKETAEEDTQLKDNNGLSEHLIEKEDHSSVVLKETQSKATIDLSLPVIGNAGVKETAVQDTQLKDNNGLSEHLIEKGDRFSVVSKETMLKATIDLNKDATEDTCLGIDEGNQCEDKDLGGDHKDFVSTEATADIRLKPGVSEVVIALRHQNGTCWKPPDKGRSSQKKRGRPRKSKLTTKAVDGINSEDGDVGGNLKVIASEDTSANIDVRNASDVVMAENNEDNTCLETPDTGKCILKRRGRPKRSKLTTQTDEQVQGEDKDIGEDRIGTSTNDTSACLNMKIIPEKEVVKTCLESTDKEASSQKRRGRPKKLKSSSQTVLSDNGGGSDVVRTVNQEEDTYLEEPNKGTHIPRKRGRSSGALDSTTETALRRSSRRVSSASLNHALSMDESFASNAASSSHHTSVVLDTEAERSREQTKLAEKIELPPSSKTLSIDEISIIDLFSVYTCLRSFSRVLFLSPFSLEAFLESLKCRFPNSLIDAIHFSILHTLKLHMEFLSDEGSQSANNCLRSLNWGLLDVVTWPIYMVEYLLIHGSALKPGFKLSRLKVLMDGYYEQSPAYKIEILRCLCDDLIETESVRSELNRRTQASGLGIDIDRITIVEMKKKRRVDDGGRSCLKQDAVDENPDWNSDECFLCKMDGNLICCDGCPAAYHTRCVGITTDTLPEGEWFCPECVVNRQNVRIKSPLRGAELLGIDPHGRLYFDTCGYLLVLDSCDPESSYKFYDCNDLKFVIEALKSSYILYGNIINAISVNWGIIVAEGCRNSQMDTSCKVVDVNGHTSVTTLSSVSGSLSDADAKPAANPYETSDRNEDFDLQGYKPSESMIKCVSGRVDQSFEKCSVAKSEALTEITNVAEVGQRCPQTSEDCLTEPFGTSSQSKVQMNSTVEECLLQSSVSSVRLEKNLETALSSHASLTIHAEEGALPQMHSKPGYYVNCYSFGQTAAFIMQEMVRNSPDKIKNFIRSPEEVISAQVKAIAKISTNFCWSTIPGLNQTQKEDCGWCFPCKIPSESGSCLFNMSCKKLSHDGSKSGAVGFSSGNDRKSHLFAVICHILSMEQRLNGLLSGPWKNANYIKSWRESVLNAPDIASVKHLLLTFESNLRRLAFLPEWSKHVDAVVTMGSSSHVMPKTIQVSSSKHLSGRKRGKVPVALSDSASTAVTKSSNFWWWRGGIVSRQLFNFKVLPHSLARKGGRQAGCKKIMGIFYPDGSDFAKRSSKYIAWRASVEMSTSVAHLAYQVRELDSNIRWDDLENIEAFSHLSKQSKKTMKLFKKVTIRRKCIEGTNIKYLLDFGKRSIPDIVIRNGVMLQESASERKKYWLEESFVPLHILKAYEEKKLARTSNKMKLVTPGDVGRILKKSSRKNGLLPLISKGQRSDYNKCGHCHRDVLLRDAVNCEDCKDVFHKRHVKKSEHSTVAKCSYQCQRCRNKISVDEPVNTEPKDNVPLKKHVSRKAKKKKAKARKSKKASIDGLRKPLPRKVKHVTVQNKKLVGAKKRKRAKSRKKQLKKSKKEIQWYGRKRTQVFYPYWCNGVRLTKNSSDAHAVQFSESKLLMPSRRPSPDCLLRRCSLCCEANYRSTAIYVSCDYCQEWFHGEAFGITRDNSSRIVGFRCYKCRNKNPPRCPYLQNASTNGV